MRPQCQDVGCCIRQTEWSVDCGHEAVCSSWIMSLCDYASTLRHWRNALNERQSLKHLMMMICHVCHYMSRWLRDVWARNEKWASDYTAKRKTSNRQNGSIYFETNLLVCLRAFIPFQRLLSCRSGNVVNAEWSCVLNKLIFSLLKNSTLALRLPADERTEYDWIEGKVWIFIEFQEFHNFPRPLWCIRR